MLVTLQSVGGKVASYDVSIHVRRHFFLEDLGNWGSGRNNIKDFHVPLTGSWRRSIALEQYGRLRISIPCRCWVDRFAERIFPKDKSSHQIEILSKDIILVGTQGKTPGKLIVPFGQLWFSKGITLCTEEIHHYRHGSQAEDQTVQLAWIKHMGTVQEKKWEGLLLQDSNRNNRFIEVSWVTVATTTQI